MVVFEPGQNRRPPGSSRRAARHFSRRERTSVSREPAFNLFRHTTVGCPKGSNKPITSHTDWSAYLSLLTTNRMTSANAAVRKTAVRYSAASTESKSGVSQMMAGGRRWPERASGSSKVKKP